MATEPGTKVVEKEGDRMVDSGAIEKKRDVFLKRYPFDCPQCGKGMSAAPSIMMTEFGINSGTGTCIYCKAFLHLEIEPDMYGEKMTAIDFKEWAKK